MSDEHHRCRSRREFLRDASLAVAGAGVAGLAGFGAACSNGARPTETPGDTGGGAGAAEAVSAGRARVATRSDGKVFGPQGHDAARVRQLVHGAVAALVGVGKPDEAFRALFDPADVVAIKVNCLAGPGLSSSPAVVDALVGGLRSIGITNDRIIIWERSSAELKKAGFELNRYSDTRPRCLGNDEGGWMPDIEFSGEVGSLWSKILARQATALINVPVLKDHDLSGVGCGMKNMYGAIHNPNRYHDNNCDPFVADVSAHRYVKDKLRLVLADALTAQCHGGPARVAAHQWRPAEVLAATDPVALDRVAEQLIDAQRAARGLASLVEAGRPPRWIETAARKGLGEHRLERIDLLEG